MKISKGKTRKTRNRGINCRRIQPNRFAILLGPMQRSPKSHSSTLCATPASISYTISQHVQAGSLSENQCFFAFCGICAWATSALRCKRTLKLPEHWLTAADHAKPPHPGTTFSLLVVEHFTWNTNPSINAEQPGVEAGGPTTVLVNRCQQRAGFSPKTIRG